MAIEKAGFTVGRDVALALDVAATEFFSDGAYTFEGATKTAEELSAYYAELVSAYPWSRSRTHLPRTTGPAGRR